MRFDPLPDARSGDSGRRFRLSRGQRLALYWSVPLLVLVTLGAAAGVGLAAVIRMPKVETLDEFSPSLVTRLFAADDTEFATYARERRVLLEEGEVPELLERAILAAEDANFRQHGGIDIQGVLRAAVRNVAQGRLAMGGSTITMQLARNLFLSPEKRWRRKIEEALLAVELEKRFSKQQILTLYCNLMFLGHGNYGFAAAALDYFGKPVAELRLTEAAALAGIPQRPSEYSPYRRPDLVIARRNYVLRRMEEEGFIGAEELERALAEPLQVVSEPPAEETAPYFSEEVRQYLEERYGSRGLLEHGLQVHTTLDRRIQDAAAAALRRELLRFDHARGWRGPIERLDVEALEEVELPSWSRLDLRPGSWNRGVVLAASGSTARVKLGSRVHELTPAGIEWTGRSLPRQILSAGDVAWFRFEESEDGDELLVLEQEPEVEGAAVVIESATGAVRAMVGGWSFARSKFNRVTQAKRQVGSAFKPFVYGAALEMGYTAADTIFDAPVAFPALPGQPPYSPRNYYRRYYGITTLRRAIEESFNVSMVKLMDLVGAEQVIDFARRCGVTAPLHPFPSLALGTADLRPIELAAAYATFANQGLYVEPYLVERVRDASGALLEEHGLTASKAMEPEVAYVLAHTLEGVVDRGTAASIADLPAWLAGKTGTTDDNSDAWFVGFTPKQTLLTWVGYDVKRSLGARTTGATAALPMWRRLIEAGLEEGWIDGGAELAPPPGIVVQPVERATGLLATPGTPRVIREAFVAGTEPAQSWEPRRARIMELPWYQQTPYYIPKAGEKMPSDVADWGPIIAAWEAD